MDSTAKMFERLREGETLLGVCLCYPAPGIVECISKGWDVVWIDAQHGQFGYDAALHAVRTVKAMGLISLLRVPTHDPGMLGAWADMGPGAVMVPMVNTPEQGRSISAALHYPPRGDRSFGGRRINDLFGRENSASHEPLTVAQIETPEAVRNAPGIIQTDGIDLLFFGADDLKLRMGVPVSTSPLDQPEVRKAMEHTARAAADAGKFAAAIASTGPGAAAIRKMGYQLLIGTSDTALLHTGASLKLKELRQALRE